MTDVLETIAYSSPEQLKQFSQLANYNGWKAVGFSVVCATVALAASEKTRKLGTVAAAGGLIEAYTQFSNSKLLDGITPAQQSEIASDLDHIHKIENFCWLA